MESTEKVSETTELLTKAFSQIHERIFAPRCADDISKFQEIVTPIITAIDAVGDFGCNYDSSIINTLDIIKHKCKGDENLEIEVSSLCSEILKLTITANRFHETYSHISRELQKSLDESYS